MERLKLQRVGRNYSGNIAYKDEKGNFYLDLNTATNAIPTELYHCLPSNDMDGEPGFPLQCDFEVINPITDREVREYHCRGKYMMLSKIYNDLTAYFGETGEEERDKQDFRYHNDKYGLWGDTIAETIDELKRRWHEIPEDLKPEWCSWEDIVKLERKAELNNFQ